uniref:Reverse transcriptase/retrotransposon-derived protein RNase H-like domain-containing protein n=1 Tax=Anguilla anguilla TaxID=7936 RepID=A0A0E9T7I0_ANGAN
MVSGVPLGRRPQVDTTAAIVACLRSKTKKEVRWFLGLAGYYRRFIAAFSEMTSPLTDLTRKGASDLVQWTERWHQAFEG